MLRSLFETARNFVLAKSSRQRALHKIDEALHKLAGGDTDICLPDISFDDEIGRLSSSVRALAEAIRCHQRVEAEVRALLAESNEMLEQAQVGILAERDGIIVTCNPCLERLFGYAPGEMVGSLCRTLYASDAVFARVEIESRQTCQRGEQFSCEAQLRRKDGNIFWAELSTADTPAEYAGARKTWVYRDINAAKRSEADMFERNRRLEKLVADRTHQLEEARRRTAGIDMATDGVDAFDRRADADNELIPFDLAGMVEGVAALAAPQAEERGLELVLEIDPRLPRSLVGTPLRLAQVLTNMLSNAIRSTKQGDVVINIREAGHRRGKLWLEFSVLDQGVAATRERQALSFKAGDPAGSSDARGLGLVIAKRLVESMGATLGGESNGGQGNVFHFTAAFEAAAQADDNAEFHARLLRAQAGRSVMLIDDNRSARSATAALLSSLGLVPVLFESGWAALASLIRPGAPDYLFICIDRHMPELDGPEVARRLKAHYADACPPLFLMTAFSHAAELKGVEQGFAAVVSKPLTIDRLFSHVVAVLGISGPGQTVKPIPHLKGKRVLLAQSAGMQREIMADFLRGAGMTARIADNGLDVLQAVREDAPDCLLLDCRMPIMDACELTGRLRTLGYTRLPIVGLSGEARAADAPSCLAAGMNEFVVKPADLPALLGILAKWMTPPVPGAAEVDGEALPPLPPELDVESGLQHLRGKTALFLKALRMFRDSCGREFQLEFRSAVRSGDWQTSERLAHRLKATAATIGAKQVSAVAARIETAIRSSNYAEANALLVELTEKLQILVQGLAHIG